MVPVLLMAAAAASSVPSAGPTIDVHCVALLALVAGEQARSRDWANIPALKDDGGRYAGIVGADAMNQNGGRARETVRDEIVAEVARLRKLGRPGRPDVDVCVVRMKSVLAEADR